MQNFGAVLYFSCIICLINLALSTTNDTFQEYLENKVLPRDDKGLGLVSSQRLNETVIFTSNARDTGNSYLPPSWDDFCTLNETNQNNVTTYAYFCVINSTSSGRWNFTELRSYVSTRDIKYSFDVLCENGANISLPLNAKATNIRKLRVRDCIATDYYADYLNYALDDFPDELEEYVLINIKYLLSVQSMVKSYRKQSDSLPKNVECGDDETLKIKIERNLTYIFSNDLDDMDKEQLGTIFARFIIGRRISSRKCHFANLHLLDTSVSRSKSRFYAESLTEQNRFPALRVLNISHSVIHYIPEQFKTWWLYFPKLEYLDMSYNRIQEIVFHTNTKEMTNHHVPTVTFDFTFNNISRLSVRNFERIIKKKGIFVKMKNNPFNCSCTDEMKDVLKYIKETDWNSKKYRRYQYLRELQCHHPENIKGRFLKSLSIYDLNCDFELMPVTVALCVFSFIIFVLIVIMLKYRREIQILFFTRFHCILPCQPSQTYDDKIFDAFVSYSNDDKDWVHSTFDYNKHKRLAHLKFCMHHKDFVAGKTILENIVKSVEDSRHTMIVLSKNFLESHFCMWEFQEAFQQSIVERKRHLIIILLEDIPENDLPHDVKRCMKTFTYIRKDDAIFTDRLLYSLSYSRRPLPAKLAQDNEAFDAVDQLADKKTCSFKQSVYESSVNKL